MSLSRFFGPIKGHPFLSLLKSLVIGTAAYRGSPWARMAILNNMGAAMDEQAKQERCKQATIDAAEAYGRAHLSEFKDGHFPPDFAAREEAAGIEAGKACMRGS